MYKGQTVAVVVPSYNEEGFVGEVIDTIPEFVDRVYVVDDRSTDRTWKEIQHHAEAVNEQDRQRVIADGGATINPRVVPIRHETNRGVGAAIKTGYRRALDDGIDVAAVMNGDGQMDPAILDRILDPVVSGRVGYAKGDRFDGERSPNGMSAWRVFGNHLLTGLTKIASGYWGLSDPQNGYTAIAESALGAIDIDGLYDRYGFLNDLLVELNIREIPIADVPMRARYGNETSGIRYSSFIPSLSVLLLRDFTRRLTNKFVLDGFNPLVLLYLFGALGIGLGVTAAVVKAIVPDIGPAGLPVGWIALVSGTVLLAMAMELDRRHHHYLERPVSGFVDGPPRGEAT